MTDKHERILLVDDERALLDAMQRTHRKSFDLTLACGPEEGLAAIKSQGPFSVVVSDHQMPGMSGIEFLRRVQVDAPDSVRVMLTGNADMQSAIDAVNEGRVFRFLSKPCDAKTFSQCMIDAIAQAQLRRAEQELLERTVRGSIEVLAEVLALANPEAFGRSKRVTSYVAQIAKRLRLPHGWQIETAALLSQIGFIAIPSDIIERMAEGQPLSMEYQSMIDRHPEVARDLLAKIPRLERVADIIANQQLLFQHVKASGLDHETAIGSQVLAIALVFDEYLSLGAGREEAIRAMRAQQGQFAPRLLGLLNEIKLPGQDHAIQTVSVSALTVGMTIDQDVRTEAGSLIVAKDNVVSTSMVERLKNYAHAGKIPARIRVRKPDEDEDEVLGDIAA